MSSSAVRLAGGMARPRRRHHQRGAGGRTLAERPVHADVGGVAGAEIVARQDHDAVVGAVAEAFGEAQL